MAHSNLVVELVEHGRAILLDYSLSYDTPREPKPTQRRRELIALARDVSERL